jgi:hypothetical protein
MVSQVNLSAYMMAGGANSWDMPAPKEKQALAIESKA